MFKEERQEFLKQDVAYTSTVQHTQNVPMYEMSLSMDHNIKGPPIAQVSSIKNFLQSRVKLPNDQSFVKILQNMLEKCNTEVEGNLE
jgi:hypothetical protein